MWRELLLTTSPQASHLALSKHQREQMSGEHPVEHPGLCPRARPGERPGEHPGEHTGECPGERQGERPGERPGEHTGEHSGEHPGEPLGEHPEEQSYCYSFSSDCSDCSLQTPSINDKYKQKRYHINDFFLKT